MPLNSLFPSARRKPRDGSAQFNLFAMDQAANASTPSIDEAAAVPAAIILPPQVVVETSRSKTPPVFDPTFYGNDKFILDEPEIKPSRDFRITEAHAIGQGGLAHKARDNLAAIKTLKVIEAENRDATDTEKIALARYVGWGALSQVFGYYPPDHLKDTAEAIRELLTDAEYKSAQASTPNAHYTSPMVIKAIWQGLQHMGVGTGARILEPAMGVGHFFGLMPDHFAGAQRTGVELDSITARIAKKLYPDAAIFAKGFEETALPDGYFDVVVGNVPFGDYAVYDPAVKHPLRQSIHDYFFAKSLMKLRPGGVMALITSRYTMDKETDTVRKHIADRADLLGAIRLPNTAFRENAGTQVTTDILFLRKRDPGQERSGHSWRELDGITSPSQDYRIQVNEYFAAQPHMMLGEMALVRGRYGNSEPTLNGELTADLLANAIGHLPAGVYIPRDQQRPPPAVTVDPAATMGVKDGAYVIRDGSLFIRNGAALEPTSLPQTAVARIVGQMAVRDAVREVLSTQLNDEPEHAIVRARLLLNREYDNFARRHGPISSRENVRAFSGDPDQPLLLSLEKYDPDSKTATKAAIFTERTLQRSKVADHVDTAAEALAISLNERGRIDWPLMQSLTKRTDKKLQLELGPMAYRNPAGIWETADAYLSGNVRTKLAEAEAASALDKSLARNVDALKAVQPVDLQPGDINARLGSSWIPAADVAAFIHHILDVPPSSVSVANSNALAVWSVDAQWGARASVNNTTTHGTTRATALDLIEGALNNRTPTIYDVMPDETRVVNQLETIAAREAQQKLKDNFSEWIWIDEARAQRLARDYNDRFNNIRLRTYDGSHQTFPGMNRTMLRNEDLDKHQKDAVWRMIQSDSTLLAHLVGSGKTFSIVASCMEMKRLGISEKPMIAVPNHLVEQWGSAFLQLYPQANILLAGKDTFTTGNRQKIMARIATGRYDAVIVAHSSFEKIPVLDDTFEDFLQGQIDQLEDAKYEASAQKGDTRHLVKELEKAKKRLAAKLKERADRENKDDGVTFEQLGVDCLFVDEADCFPHDAQVVTDCGVLSIGEIVDRRLDVKVLSYDIANHRHEWKRVTDWIAKETTEPLVRVSHELGSFTCTGNHEVWTKEGYIPALHLLPSHNLQILREHVRELGVQQSGLRKEVLQSDLLQRSEGHFNEDGNEGVHSLRQELHLPKLRFQEQREAKDVQQPLCCSLSKQPAWHKRECQGEACAVQGHDARYEVSGLFEPQEPMVEPGICGTDPEDDALEQNCHEGRQRSAATSSAVPSGDSPRFSDGVRSSDEARQDALSETAQLLQGGYSSPTEQDRDRVRRSIAQHNAGEIERCKEDGRSSVSRVVGVEIFERADHDRPGDDCGARETVYCLEVEDHHNFYADGVLVSNCFKNLAVTTKMTRVAGLPNTESNRAADMFMKAEYLRSKGCKRGYATGTPISNSMVEMYTWQRHLDPEGLRAAGVEHFDAWAANFGESVTSLELAPDGSGYRMHTRFSKFVNLPELLSMFRSFADVQTAEMLNLPRPALDGGKPKIAVAPASLELKEFVATLVERAKDLRQKRIDPSIDNMLKITGDGRKAALDMRLVDPYAEPSDTKVERAIERIHSTWMETHANRSTQLVFCDLATPKPDRFNIYHEMRDRLLERGVPDREVAFIHDADTDAKKKALFDSVNAGRVRILMGSTEKMGAGTNVQKRLKALHHLDAPWRPRDIEQREGRILRQGNDNETVDIYRYVTEGSFDAYMWQTLETKARFIGQVMSGSVTVREAEDLDGGALTYAEIKAIASGNPAVMEKVRVDTEIRKLDQLRASHINQQHKIRWELRNIPEQLESSAKYLTACREDISTRDAHDAEEFSMTVGNRTYTGKDARMRAGEALNEVASSWRNDQSMQVRAHYKGFDILTRAGLLRDAEPDLFIRGKATYRANINLDSAAGTMSSIDYALRKLDQLAEAEQQEIARQEKALADYKTQLGRPFDHADRLKELVAKQAELNALLDLDKSDAQAVADTPTVPAEVAQPAPAPFERAPPPPVPTANGLAGILARSSIATILDPAP